MPDSPSRSLQLVSVHVPESEERQEIKERRAELVLASSFYQGIHVKRRKEEENGRTFKLRKCSSGRTGSRVSWWKQRVQRFLKSLLLRTSTCTRDTRRSNEESNNAHITTNHQSSNPEQDSAPSEKLPLSNPHLLDDVADGMKEDVGDNSMRSQHQELVTDEEEK